jgi:hypothetical protein
MPKLPQAKKETKSRSDVVCYTGPRPRGKKDDSYTSEEFVAFMKHEASDKKERTLDEWIEWAGAIRMKASKCRKVTKCNDKLSAAGEVIEKTEKPLKSCIESKCHSRYELMARLTNNSKTAMSSFDKHASTARCGAVHCSNEGVKYGKATKKWDAISKRCDIPRNGCVGDC